ncbi:pyrrolysine--tRNA(Pyl) ligase large subunit [Acetobacterium sp.]|uniref:pyrrolysine--tRNA(Pyl) ligase large subunit n=1 Tax=Acetobacterium sp. TaxID=1872094 RepID=UPI0035948B46
MKIEFTSSQIDRLKSLGSDLSREMCFETTAQRESQFKELEKTLVLNAKKHLNKLRQDERKPLLARVQESLVNRLTQEGFVQVVTPTIISKKFLEQMTIDESHDLYAQVFWVDKNKCLRPMLAPNLYSVSRELLKIWEKPVRIFEIGSCFRKESQGHCHLNEFTMLNLVEWGTPIGERDQRIRELADLVMNATGLTAYQFEAEESVVYGTTIDVVKDGLELGSSSKGPHPLDPAWGITDSWVGIGFGLERLLMIREKKNNIQALARSIAYLDGVRLNIK